MRKKLKIAVVLVVVLFGSAYGLSRSLRHYYYPFGCYHRCDKQLWFALQEYAQQHGGKFPYGQASPEASLSLLGPKYGYLLRRRDVPLDVVQQMLDSGELLGPETCGYNYTEGLCLDSNPKLALFWDKEGLSEMGRRFSTGGHIVAFVGADWQHIPDAIFGDFLDQQQRLLADENRKAGHAKKSRQ